MDEAHRALRNEIFRRLDEVRDDPSITNTDGSNYWGPRITRAVKDREDDGPALVKYVKGVLRKTGESEGWNALLEADRIDLSFEDMVLNAHEPIRGLFTDRDRRLAAEILGEQQSEIDQRRDVREAEALEHDHLVMAEVRRRREADGKPWTPEIEAEMLDRLAERRRKGGQR
jgi:hypothetical protein